MTIPEPELGLVVSYAYLWHFERSTGRDEGRKERPCLVISVEPVRSGMEVVVLPITHREPLPERGVELPHLVKRSLRLDDARSWVVVDEGNIFSWAGFDLRPIRVSGSVGYGLVPPRLFRQVLGAFSALRQGASSKLVARD